ncbi:MgtC/SapB family protein [Chitinophaga cymbidii]|uniref:MgtC/SapB/SrpB/YhiD N-terminal domain-containing protein n=1 Tax=Chitinophaga cymbidii TaxID=1096750 RepID=A0A512RSD8_9BACT|nr:MgtC/SapB family protein [Chitinophaga cymbidii]GEP98611.1 hypothetical protein CCY01nite_48710 [Chitinophaga cymbidii]
MLTEEPIEITCSRVAMALLAGCLLGLEREWRRKAAGIRTIALICMSSTLFTILSIQIGGVMSSDRIASNILTGVGFIGAGVIFRGGFTVDGITTAATIWISAAIGMAIGIGDYRLAWFTEIVAISVLAGLSFVEDLIIHGREKKYYAIRYQQNAMSTEAVEQIFRDNQLRIKKISTTKTTETGSGEVVLEGKYELTGRLRNMVQMNEALIANEHVIHFDVEMAK